jgi:hypothetical protein
MMFRQIKRRIELAFARWAFQVDYKELDRQVALFLREPDPVLALAIGLVTCGAFHEYADDEGKARLNRARSIVMLAMTPATVPATIN